MALENFGTPIRLEVKSEKEILLLEKLTKLRILATGLGATAAALFAVLVLNADLGKKPIGGDEKDMGKGNAREQYWANYDANFEKTLKDIKKPFPYTLHDVDWLLINLDEKVRKGEVDPEQIEDLIRIAKDGEDKINSENSKNVNEDGGTIETGGPVIGSEEVR
jgi:dGTP triphosphohydrolase